MNQKLFFKPNVLASSVCCKSLPDGSKYVREIVRHPGAVVILPLLDDGQVVFIRNYRVAVNETLIELPAGTLDRSEDPLSTAKRELAEETGYRAGNMELFTDVLHVSGHSGRKNALVSGNCA